MASTKTQDGEDCQGLPTWIKPTCTSFKMKPRNQRKSFVTRRYHGILAQEEVEKLVLQGGDGSYLIRKSDRAPNPIALVIRFDGRTRYYKLFYDGLHYVGEKRFETNEQLVEDGLINFYLESRAADYIATLSDKSNYAELPYLAYSVKKKRLVEHASGSMKIDETDEDYLDDIEKPHVFKTTNFMGLHWCDFCANFMWGLVAQGSKCQVYQLQNEAPKAKKIVCNREQQDIPTYYGTEYHGILARADVEKLMLQGGDGSYLIRKSDRAPNPIALVMRFDGQTGYYILFYEDGLHYVGEKRFETIEQLVEDGLITLYMESRAADYIATLSDESKYAQSPYLAYSVKKKQRLQSRRNRSEPRVEYAFGSMKIDEADEDDLDDIEKTHVFKTTNFIGLHWCDLCANFMWGLIAQGSKCQDCGFEAHTKCSEKVPPDCMPDLKYLKSIFGAVLATVIKATKSPIPMVVEKCVKEIESRGLECEGLYRVPGSHEEIEEIKMAFDKDGDANITTAKYESINTITSVLKLYFRLLPIPLITYDAYTKIKEGIEMKATADKVLFAREGLAKLPPSHYQTLKYLVSHLVRVTEKESLNMMGAANLAMVFAPTLMHNTDIDPLQGLASIGVAKKINELLISQYKDLFLK